MSSCRLIVTCLVFVSTEVITFNVPVDYFESKGFYTFLYRWMQIAIKTEGAHRDLLLKIFHFQWQHSLHVLHLLLCVESKGGVMRSWFQWKWKLNACWHLVLSNVKVHRLSIREMRHSLKWTISSREWQKYWTEPNGLKQIEFELKAMYEDFFGSLMFWLSRFCKR